MHNNHYTYKHQNFYNCRHIHRSFYFSYNLLYKILVKILCRKALFLSALQGEGLLLGSFIGLIIAAGISVLLYKTTIKLDLRKFFIITGSLLILVAAGLMAHTIHALGELGIVPAIVEHLWNLEWLISDESLLGRILD